MKKNVTKRILCLILTLALMVSNVPATAFATATPAEEETAAETLAPTDAMRELVQETSAPTEAATDEVTEALTQPAVPEKTSAPTEAAIEPVATEPVKAASVTVSLINEITKLTVGERVQLTALVLPEDAADKTVFWSSSDDTIVTVDEKGEVTAMAAGSATITATCDEAAGVYELTVKAAPEATESAPSEPEETTAPTETLGYEEGRVSDDAALTTATVSGTCGDNLTWEIDEWGTLTISGSGDMFDYRGGDYTPWCDYADTITEVIITSGVTSIGNHGFDGCSELISISIPDSVVRFGSYAFFGCNKLESDICIPDEQNVINEYTFAWCSKMRSIVIPEGVTTIGEYAFAGCTELMIVMMPASVMKIGSYAFYGCDQLCHVYYSGTDTQWKSRIGNNHSGLSTAERHCENNGINWVKDEEITCTSKRVFRCRICGKSLFDTCYKTAHQYVDGVCTICESPSGWEYSVGDLGVTVTKYSGSDTNVEIPSVLEGLPVIAIGYAAFSGQNRITSVVIPDGVRLIDDHAFNSCTGLTNVVIPNSVTSIGYYSFRACTSLTKIKLPSSLTSIGISAFETCVNLRDVYITDLYAWRSVSFASSKSDPMSYASNLHILDESGQEITEFVLDSTATSVPISMFKDCSSLRKIVIPTSVTSIGASAFYNCTSLRDFEIPDGVTSIGESAFYNCSSLMEIEIPDSVISIGKSVFFNCSNLKSIIVPGGVTKLSEGVFHGCRNLESMTIPFVGSCVNPTENAEQAFGYIFGEESYSGGVATENINHTYYIPESLNSLVITGGKILKYAFYNCNNLKSVIVGDAVSGIGAHAFQHCNSLENVTIGDGVTSIGENAFYGCINLRNVTIGNGTTSIDEYAFYNCKSLTTITIPESVTSVGENVFYNCINLTDIYITNIASWLNISWGRRFLYSSPMEVNSKPKRLYLNGTLLTNLVIPDGVASIPFCAFAHCDSLLSVDISDSVTSIGEAAFEYCGNLRQVKIGNGVSTIGLCAFQGSPINEVTFGNGIRYIDRFAFRSCGFSTLTITADNVDIEKEAFASNDKLTNVWIKAGSVGELAFSGCTNLQKVTLLSGGVGDLAFEGCVSLAETTISNASIGIGSFAYCINLENVTLGDGVSSIGTGAFGGCISLRTIVIPDSVSSISDSVFGGCINLESITLPFVGNSRKASDDRDQYPFGYIFGEGHYDGGVATTQTYQSSAYGVTSATYYIPSSLREVTITDGAVVYGAFYNCSNLTEITLNDGASGIGPKAFFGCSNLQNITIGSGVTYIGENAFLGCASLKDAYITNPSSWCKINFSNTLSHPTTPAEGVLHILSNGSETGNIVLNHDVTRIPERAFQNCVNVTSIKIPSSVTNIDNYAFTGCTNLEDVYITDPSAWCKITYENGPADPLGSPMIYADQLHILDDYGNEVTNIVLDSSVTTIPKYAFKGSKIVCIVIPESVKYIASGSSFAFTDNLWHILYTGTREQWHALILAGNIHGKATVHVGVNGDEIADGTRTTCYDRDLYHCSYCGNTYVERFDEPKHIFGEWTLAFDAGCTDYGEYHRICERDNCEEFEIKLIEPYGHIEVIAEGCAPTCTEDGLTEGRSCTRCEKTYTAQTVIPALGHTVVVQEGTTATCTENGITEGRYCSVCEEVLAVQEELPALGHAYAEQGDCLVCEICGHEVYIHIQQDYLAMDLQTFTWAQLDMELSRADLAESIVWSIEGDKDIVAVEDGLVYITGNGTGNAYVIATITVDNGLEKSADGYETYTVSSRCRVEVAESIQLKGIQLSTDKVTTELFKTDYAAFEVLLQLPEYYPVTDTAMTVSRPAGMSLAGAGKQSNMIDAVAFTTQELNDLFELKMLDDRTVQLIPRYETAIEMALANSRSVKGTYKDTVKVTVQGTDYYSEMLTLTVKQTKPKLTGTVPAFNSFYTGQTQQITIKGATPKPDGFSPNEAKATAKTPAIPAWLKLQEDTLTLTPDAPLKNASGTAHLLVETEQWRIPAAVSVSVKNTYKAPALKLSATSVPMSTESSAGAALKLLCINKKDTLSGLNVTGIEATGGFVVEEGSFNIADGSFILHAPEGFTAQTVTLKVYFNQEVTTNTLTLKLKVTPKAVTLKLSKTSANLNLISTDYVAANVTVTPADHRIKNLNISYTGPAVISGKKVTVDKTYSDELDISYLNGQLKVKPGQNIQLNATYKINVSADGSKPVTMTVKTYFNYPSMSLKVTGSMDLSFPNQTALITPTLKNFSGSIYDYDYHVTELKGKTVVKEDASKYFSVEKSGNGFAVRCVDETAVNTANTYALKLRVFLMEDYYLEGTVNLKVKRTAVKLKLDKMKLTLNKATGDSGSVAVTCTTKGYDFTEPVREVTDKYKQAAADQLDIGWENGRLIVKTVPETVYGMTYTVTLRGDAYGTPAKLTVSIPMEEKSTVTATLKSKGSIDVIRDGSAITLTPTYKNITDRTGLTESLVFSKTANRVTTNATDLFDYSKNGDGTFTVTKKAGAKLDHSAKYKVKLVTYKGEAKLCETKEISISVKAGSAKLTVKTDNTTLFAKDKNDRALVWFEAADASLNGVKDITIASATQAKQFEVIPYGNGVYAIGFAGGKADSALTKKNINSVSIKLNVFLKGNETSKASTTATVKLTIVK